MRRGDVERRRDDHRLTTTEIGPACRFFIGHPDDRDQTLAVPDVPEWATRYRTVFKNLAHSHGRAGETRIWWSRVDPMQMADYEHDVLILQMAGGCRFVVDRRGWGKAANAFDRRLNSVFASAREAIKAKEVATWVNVLAFGHGELDVDGTVRIIDARKFHALIELVRGSPGADGRLHT